MSQTALSATPSQKGGRIVRAGLAATVAAIIGNVIVFYIGNALTSGGLTMLDPAGSGRQIPAFVAAPIIFTAVGLIGATIVFAIVKRFSANPVRVFTIVSLIALALSYLTFLSPIELAPPTAVTFGIMHVVAAVIGVPILIALGK